MNIHTAMHYVSSGCRVRRKAWIEDLYVVNGATAGQVILLVKDKLYSRYYRFDYNDIRSDDWELYDEPSA
jgi:hypothetical protein